MNTKKVVLCVIGTRPEAIKMAPVVMALRTTNWADVKILVTAQHREMLDQVLSLFDISADFDLNIMQDGQELPTLTSRLLLALDRTLTESTPDIVLAQGDTTTVMTTALACYYRKIPYAHIEAGLRTGNISSPFPEEMNRIVASHLSLIHFAPTETSRTNLLRENIPESAVHVTGNTVIDTLLMICEMNIKTGLELDRSKRLILMTSHRRENFGAPMQEAFSAIREMVETRSNIELVYPVHPNPNVKEIAHEKLGNHNRIRLVQPMAYAQFVQLMKQSYFIISDSGGIQEEAPALGKPVLVLREETERPEAIETGMVKLVGTNRDRILMETDKLFDDDIYKSVTRSVSPYGDGKAAERIVTILAQWAH